MGLRTIPSLAPGVGSAPHRRSWRRFANARLLLPAVCLSLVACDRSAAPGSASPSRKPRNLLLITLDTTRADRLGCYGYADARTPALDGLAKEGVLFERTYCQVPLTLPSHASILTGRYPREIGLRDNGHGALAEEHPTLATIAAQAGLKTSAFLASFVLDGRFGLSRGFAHYDDDLERKTLDVELDELERRGDIVTDHALTWLKANGAGSEPFFCWVHYYDPHDPYEPPAEYRADAKTPYDGEVAFVDAQIKRLLTWVDEAQRGDDTLIVVVGDHGESFGEHGEHGHAMFVYESNIHVPLIFAFRGGLPAGRRIAETIELTSVQPTVCELMGWDNPVDLSSPSLVVPLLGGASPTVSCYAESQYVANVHRWAEQRALVDGQWKYISSAKPELYDLRQDPNERANVITQHADTAREMERKLRDRYAAMQHGAAAVAAGSEENRRAVESLGYVSGSGAASDEFLTAGAPDPKDLLPLLDQFRRARRPIQERRFTDALALLEPIAAASPNSLQFQYTLGTVYVQAGQVDQAIATLGQALRIAPRDARTLVSMGDALVLKSDIQKAADCYYTAVAIDDTDPEAHAKLARVASMLGRGDVAVTEYQKALTLFPGYVDAGMELISTLMQQKREAEIVPFFERLAQENPRSASASFGVGVALLAASKFDEAISRFQATLKLDPDYGHAYNKLGICLARQGKEAEAEALFEKAKNYAESRAEAWYNSGIALSKRNEPTRSAEAYEQALRIKPDYPSAIAALSRHYAAARDIPTLVRLLRAGAKNCPNDVRVHTTLADVLATCNDPALRNGTDALFHARRAIELAGGVEHPGLLATRAAAEAETGDFPSAKQTAERARQLAEKAGERGMAASIAAQLAGYERGQAYRNPAY